MSPAAPSLDDVRMAWQIALDETIAYLRGLSQVTAPLAVDVDEAARLIGCSSSHVRRLVAAGVLPKVPDMGDRVLVPVVAIAAHVNAGTPGTPSLNHPSAQAPSGLRLVTQGDPA
jgi:excisionase family DNA binding protein